jgi:hypothetical protein
MASDEARRKAGPTPLLRAIEEGVNAATEAVIVANRADANFMMIFVLVVVVVVVFVVTVMAILPRQ